MALKVALFLVPAVYRILDDFKALGKLDLEDDEDEVVETDTAPQAAP